MKILALDVSTKTGWALFEGENLDSYGLITKQVEWDAFEYPLNFVLIAENVANQIGDLVSQKNPSDIVIEEINKTGRFGSRHSQKILDFIHLAVLQKLTANFPLIKIHYVNTSDWRKTLKLSVATTKKLAKPFLKDFAKMKKEFNSCQDRKQKKILKEQLKEFSLQLKNRCIHGKIDKKSISVAYVNANFNLSLKKGDNDASDAICQANAFLLGCPVVTNKDIFENNK